MLIRIISFKHFATFSFNFLSWILPGSTASLMLRNMLHCDIIFSSVPGCIYLGAIMYMHLGESMSIWICMDIGVVYEGRSKSSKFHPEGVSESEVSWKCQCFSACALESVFLRPFLPIACSFPKFNLKLFSYSSFWMRLRTFWMTLINTWVDKHICIWKETLYQNNISLFMLILLCIAVACLIL